jgi:hypothetical protein
MIESKNFVMCIGVFSHLSESIMIDQM